MSITIRRAPSTRSHNMASPNIRGLQAFRLREPRRAARRHACPREPDRLTSFDKFNPFTLRGNPAPGLGLCFESLTTGSPDEVASAYCLSPTTSTLHQMAFRPPSTSIRKRAFRMATRSRPRTSRFSFDTLKSPQALRSSRCTSAQIARAVVVDRLTIRFDYKVATREMPLLAGGIPVFCEVGHEAGRHAHSFRPARVREADSERRLSDRQIRQRPHHQLQAQPQLLGRIAAGARGYAQLCTHRLQAVFRRIAKLEAFKAGEYDVLVENVAQSWVRRDVGRRFDSGELIKREFPHHNGAACKASSSTCDGRFSSDCGRQALDLALDFQWLNRQLFFDQYKRTGSFFANTDLQATGSQAKAS